MTRLRAILIAIGISQLLFFCSYSCLHGKVETESPTWRMDETSPDQAKWGFMRWQQLPVRWSFMCGEADVPEFRAGFQWWNDRFGKVFEEVRQDDACLCGEDAGVCPQLLVLEGIESEDISSVLTDGGIKSYARTFMIHDGGFFTSGMIRYYDEYGDADEEAQRTITRHEAGHALGLMHSGKQDCLMYPTVDKDAIVIKPICPGEEKLFREVYGVP